MELLLRLLLIAQNKFSRNLLKKNDTILTELLAEVLFVPNLKGVIN